MSLVLDAGALIAIEKADRDTVALIKQELLHGRTPLTLAELSDKSGEVEPGVKSN